MNNKYFNIFFVASGLIIFINLSCVFPATASPIGSPVLLSPRPEIGTHAVVTPDFLVSRPNTPPCEVKLFSNISFEGSLPKPIDYSAPSNCPMPWGKVVFEADFHIGTGQQYDRTSRVSLGGVNLFTGTTSEPGASFSPMWHVERDVTDYAALFQKTNSGEAELVNGLAGANTARIVASARLIFYPVASGQKAPDMPNMVFALHQKPIALNAKAPTLESTISFPRNMTRLALDVLAMPQQVDEFWYMCMPMRETAAAVAPDDNTCGYPYRETEVRIDGKLAGVAPVFPWIYTGGLNSVLWKQIPGIETLNLSSYRINLTPFAGSLNDGKPHQVALTVVGVRRSEVVTAAMLVWRDPVKQLVSGHLIRDDGEPIVISINRKLPSKPDFAGKSLTEAHRRLALEGFVETSKGRMKTKITQEVSFNNTFTTSYTGSEIDQIINIDTHTLQSGGGVRSDHDVVERFPLVILQGRSGSGREQKYSYDIHQELIRNVKTDFPSFISREMQTSIDAKAEIPLVKDGTRTRPSLSSSRAESRIRDSVAGCYDRTLFSQNLTLVSVTDGCAP